jgi:hypothetical protein
MPFKVVRISERPNASVPLYIDNTPACQQWIQSDFISTGKIISLVEDWSPDQLTYTRTTVFASQADYRSFVEDGMALYWDERIDYDAQHGIVSTIVEQVEI